MDEREQIAHSVLAATREIIRRGVLTMAAIPDPDARFRGYASLPQNVVRDAKEAYGYSPPRAREFTPTRQDVSQLPTVMGWLAWVRRDEGEEALRRINAWAIGNAMWRLAQREGCSEQTVRNRIDRSIAAILRQFASADISVEAVDEPEAGIPATPFSMLMEKSPGPHGQVKLAKVFVSDMGFVKNGRVWRDGSDRLRRIG